MKPSYRKGFEAAGAAFFITLVICYILVLLSLAAFANWSHVLILPSIVAILTGLFVCDRAHIRDLEDELYLLAVELKKLKENK